MTSRPLSTSLSPAIPLLALVVLPVISGGCAHRQQMAGSGIPVVNVADFGAIPNDSADDTAGVTRAIEACERGDTKTLSFPAGTYNLSTIEFPDDVHVVMPAGAFLQIDADATVTFDGTFDAGLYNVFSNSGKVHFGNAVVKEVYPQWWVSTGGDDSVAIKKAVDSAPGQDGVNVRLIGTFHCRSTILINRHRAHLVGMGQYATKVLFDPPGPAPLFEFKHGLRPGVYKTGARLIVQCSIKDLAIYGAADNVQKKVAIKVVDADVIEVSGIAIQRWFGDQSIGLQLQGREFGFFDNMSIRADLPISIEKNPNLNWISIDMFVFRNMWLLVEDPNGPAVRIASGVALTNVLFDGTHSWNGGKYGLYWVDTESKGTSLNLSIKNVRMEQGKAHGGHIVHIDHNFALQNLIIENVNGINGGVGGLYLRRCHDVTISNFLYSSTDKDPVPVPMDIDETCSGVVLVNTHFHSGPVKTGALAKTFGTRLQPQLRNRPLEVLDRPVPGRPRIDGIIVNGTKMWCHSGKLADGETMLLPIGAGMGTRIATVTIAATDGISIEESGQFMVTRNKTVLISGTRRIATETADGKLVLVPGNQAQLINRLGAEVDVVVSAFAH